jgi:hypothetical protein
MKIHTSLAAAILALIVLSIAPAAHAQCSLATLSGGWAYRMQGSYTVLGTKNTDYRIEAGLITFNGAGHLTQKNSFETVNNSSPLITRWEINVGTYTLSSACTGTLILHGSPNTIHFAIQMNATNTGFTLTCTDSNAEVWNPMKSAFTSTYNGTALQQ